MTGSRRTNTESWKYAKQYSILLKICLATLCFLVCNADMSERDLSERRLNRDLFISNGYNPLIRPVKNTTESLLIRFSLALSAIINVDEKNQVLVTNVWLQIYWTDYQLEWNPEDYDNITQIKVNHTKLWTPEIVLFNNADGNFEPSYYPNCVVSNTGFVAFIPPAIYTSSCTINVEYFPFDQQVCDLKFGSWTFEGKTLHYTFEGKADYLILTDYMRNGAWDIVDSVGQIETLNDTVSGEPKEIIVYNLVLRRKTLFYTVNLIIPCFLHAFCCLWVFLLPTDGCEKVTLVISVLVSLVVLLLVLQKILPPSKTIPLVAKYFIFTFLMNVLETAVSIGIVYYSYKSPRTANVMPKWMCWFFLYKLPKFLFMERPDHEERWEQKSCTPPPSYPNTPTIPRANLAIHAAAVVSNASAAVIKQRKLVKTPSTPGSKTVEGRESARVQDWRQKFSKGLSQGVTLTSSTSGSHGSSESPTLELKDFPMQGSAGGPQTPNAAKFKPPPNGHRCMLRDSCASHSSEGSLDFLPPPPPPPRPASAGSRRFLMEERGISLGGSQRDIHEAPRGGAARFGPSSGGATGGAEDDFPTIDDHQYSQRSNQVREQQRAGQDNEENKQRRSYRLPPRAFTKEIYSAANAIKYICHQMQNKEDYETVLDDWKYLAAVVDRLLMIIFVLVSASGTIGVLVNAPHILESVDQDKVIEKYSPV